MSHPAAEGFQRLARQDETQEIQVVASLARDKWDIQQKKCWTLRDILIFSGDTSGVWFNFVGHNGIYWYFLVL